MPDNSTTNSDSENGSLHCPSCDAVALELPVFSVDKGSALPMDRSVDLSPDTASYKFTGYEQARERPLFAEGGVYLHCQECSTLLVHGGRSLTVASAQHDVDEPFSGLAPVPISALQTLIEAADGTNGSPDAEQVETALQTIKPILDDWRNRRLE